MSHTIDCEITLLPSDSCAHCSGVGGIEEPWYERGMEVKTLTDRQEEGEFDALPQLKGQLEAQLPRTGRWNKTKETYGGNDNQHNFEDINLAEVAGD